MKKVFFFKILSIIFLTFRGNNNVTLYLTWNIIPNVGALPNVVTGGSHRIEFPKEYASSTSA